MPAEDLASTTTSARQLRDFTSRILDPLADRLALSDPDWTRVSLDRLAEYAEFRRSEFEFAAERDLDSEDTEFRIYMSHILALDDEWSDSIEFQKLKAQASYGDQTAEGAVLEGVSEEAAEDGYLEDECDGDESPVGYWSYDVEYVFQVPFSPRLRPKARKELTMTFYDEDCDPFRSLQITDANRIPGTSTLDLEHLVRYGEVMMLEPDREAELMSITVHDLGVILDGLKSHGLVSRASKVLSARASAPIPKQAC